MFQNARKWRFEYSRFPSTSFISFYIENGKVLQAHYQVLQAHYFDFLGKNFPKGKKFTVVLKEINGEHSVQEWRILRICKTGVLSTLWFLLFMIQ